MRINSVPAMDCTEMMGMLSSPRSFMICRRTLLPVMMREYVLTSRSV